MKKIVLSILTIAIFISCNNIEKPKEKMAISYPKTKKVDTVDVYFGNKVTDPYRWLEDDNSEETKAWVKAENEVTQKYLSEIPFISKVKERLKKLMDYPKRSEPFFEGGKYFFYKNDGLQNQSILMVQDNLDAQAKVLLDPNKLSDDGTVSLSNISVSKDGKYLVYSVARSGSDWNEIYVRDITTTEDIDEHIKWVKFSGISWYNNGFYYSGYNAPKDGKALTAENKFHKLFYHKLGTSQEKDVVVIESKTDSSLMYTGGVSDDAKFLIIDEEKLGTRGNKIIIKDLTNTASKFVELNKGFDNRVYLVDNIGNDMYISTNENAPNNKLIKITFPNTKAITEIIPEKKEVLDGISLVNGKLFANYMKDAHNKLEVYDYSGKYLYDIKLPSVGTVSTPNGKIDQNIIFYTFTSFTYPSIIYKYNVSENKSEIYYKSELDFKTDDYETKQVFYTSKDGTKIPMFIVYKKGLKLNGNNPTLLYGYGGFNISLTPSFSVTRLVLLENGGVFAMANIRGGGEYGEEWHQAGTKLNKQNVFDDFIAAGEYLIKEGYTSNKKLAIQGGSNGGLLVGAVVNQRPDLMQVALPAVGVMDMLRFHKFTIGSAWVSDYGSSEENIEEFNYLLKYSPVHNVKENVNYPAIMVMTADHDDRVVPAHSFKYAATLQEKYKGTNPVLIRIESKAGHGAGKPTEKVIEESSDIYSFMFYNMGLELYPDKK